MLRKSSGSFTTQCHTTNQAWLTIDAAQTYKRRGRKELGARETDRPRKRERERETIVSPRYDRVTHAERSHMEGGGRVGEREGA